ncbi:MAG: hypothetical protein Q9183_005482 [Haloplaca sp. 2 TL-2023]
MSNADSNDPDEILEFQSDFSAWAGQVANYMSKHKYKYGFLSTYNETIFFKQETHRLTGALARANHVRNGEQDTSDGTDRRIPFVPDPDKKSSSSSPSPSKPSSSKGKAPHQRSHTTGDSLVGKMNGLKMDSPDVAKAKAKSMQYPTAKGHSTGKSGTWTWEKGDKKGEVDSSRTHHGILLVTIYGKEYRGIPI